MTVILLKAIAITLLEKKNNNIAAAVVRRTQFSNTSKVYIFFVKFRFIGYFQEMWWCGQWAKEINKKSSCC